MKKDKIINFNKFKLNVAVYSYANNNRLAIFLNDSVYKEPFSCLTINLDNDINYDEGFINADLQNVYPELINILKEIGIIKKSYGFVKYNYGKYEYVKFDLKKLKEYDIYNFRKVDTYLPKEKMDI